MTIAKELPVTREEAVKVMSRTVGKIASKWTRNHRQDYYDIFNEGMIGVLVAYDKFDGSKGASFSTYAYLWINHYVRQYALKSWTTKNNTTSLELNEWSLGTTDADEQVHKISVSNQIAKMDEEVQMIFKMRKEGYSFKDIAEEIGSDSLHKVRNKFVTACEILE